MTLGEVTKIINKDEFWIKLNSERRSLDNPRLYNMSSLGRLLEDLVFTSKSLKDCLERFGSDAENDMTNFVILQIPLVGGTIYTALEFYGLGKIVTSENISDGVKSEEIFKTVTRVSMSIGTAVTGGIVGQILIPVPVVGALVGSVVGGAIGSLFGKAIDGIKTHDPIPFSLLVQFLMKVRLGNGSWDFTVMTGVIKDVIARWFTLSKPKELKNEDLWLTILSFVSISLYLTVIRSWARKGVEMDDQMQIDAKTGNVFMEATIVYLAQRINLLKYDKDLIKINQVLGILIKDQFINFDLEKDPEKKMLEVSETSKAREIPEEGSIRMVTSTSRAVISKNNSRANI